MVIPEIGLDDVPIRPQMRDETVTKRKPKITTRTAATRLANAPVGAPGIGMKVRKAHIATAIISDPPSTTLLGRSFDVRLTTSAPVAPRAFWKSAAPARSAAMIVGNVRINVIRPAAATAPAPM